MNCKLTVKLLLLLLFEEEERGVFGIAYNKLESFASTFA